MCNQSPSVNVLVFCAYFRDMEIFEENESKPQRNDLPQNHSHGDPLTGYKSSMAPLYTNYSL